MSGQGSDDFRGVTTEETRQIVPRAIGFFLLLAMLVGVTMYLLLILHQPPIQIASYLAIAFVISRLAPSVLTKLQSSWKTGRIARLRGSKPVAKIRELFPLSELAFFLVFAVEVLLSGLAYAVTLVYPGNGAIVDTIVTSLVTVEGLLLALLSLSVFSRNVVDKRVPYLAILTIFSVFFSLATIMLAELSAQLVSWALPTFFIMDVLFFVLVGTAYSWFLIKASGTSHVHLDR